MFCTKGRGRFASGAEALPLAGALRPGPAALRVARRVEGDSLHGGLGGRRLDLGAVGGVGHHAVLKDRRVVPNGFVELVNIFFHSLYYNPGFVELVIFIYFLSFEITILYDVKHDKPSL